MKRSIWYTVHLFSMKQAAESQPTRGRTEQVRRAHRARQTLGILTIAAFSAHTISAGADIIDPHGVSPKMDYIIGSSAPPLSVTAVDSRIPAEVADDIAQSQVMLDVNVDGAVEGTFANQKCGGTYVIGGGIETAAHCFATDLAVRGSTSIARAGFASRFNTATVTPFDRNGALPMMVPRSTTLFENNLPQGNHLVGVTPGEPDSIELRRKDGKLAFPLKAAVPASQPLQMDQELYLLPMAVDTQMYRGVVTGTYTGINGVDAIVARFEPLNGKNPLRAGASGSGVFTVENGEARVAAVVSGTFYREDATGIDAILSQDDVRRLSAKHTPPEYGPHLHRQMPEVNPSGELGLAGGFTPKNTIPSSSRQTLYQCPNLREQAKQNRRRKS